LKSYKKATDVSYYYADPTIGNDPKIIYFIGLDNVSKSYERKVYSLLDMLGYVGGLF